ncbi:MAG TPA: nucleotide exchange factor GrpE [Verrucomicrobiae bacterium]|nr:nucleotide exchange factor GrpE [Verrucomicrobiae bacterium]
MHDLSAPKISKWPFFFADAVLLALAVFIFRQAEPLGNWQTAGVVACVIVGGVFGVWPFILDYLAATKLAETDALTSVVGQVQNIEIIAKRISEATSLWQGVSELAEKTNVTAKEISGRMAHEAKEFAALTAKSNDAEKATLRVEVEKLRRSEGDWLQVIVRVFDYIYALQGGAMRSGNPKLVDQVTQFVNSCRDAARRIGLVPFFAARGDKFDPQRHQTVDGKAPHADAVIGETLGIGYTFQGQILRPAIVQIREPVAPVLEPAEASGDQDQLPLGAAE